MEKMFAYGAIGSVSYGLIFLLTGGGDPVVRYGLISSLNYLLDIGTTALHTLPI